jgi:hypothetical protein
MLIQSWSYEGKGYVTADGNYGGDAIVVFERDSLTSQQWDNLGEMSDSSRIDYVRAILDGADLSEWED